MKIVSTVFLLEVYNLTKEGNSTLIYLVLLTAYRIQEYG